MLRSSTFGRGFDSRRLHHIELVASQNFFQLRKRKFFCFAFLLTQELRKRSHLIVPLCGTGRRAEIHFPHTPFSFCPLAFGLRPIFFGGGAIVIYSRPCPTPPIRGRQQGTPYNIVDLFDFFV